MGTGPVRASIPKRLNGHHELDRTAVEDAMTLERVNQQTRLDHFAASFVAREIVAVSGEQARQRRLHGLSGVIHCVIETIGA